jgi:hypothetical protein
MEDRSLLGILAVKNAQDHMLVIRNAVTCSGDFG